MISGGFFALLSSILFFTSYMENDSSYPQPLDSAAEKKLIDAAQNGDMEARDTLVKHNMRLVVHIAKKYTNYPDIEELISVGSMGLIKGINTYSSGKNTALATYCARCIENEMLMAIRSGKKHKNNRSLYDPVGTDKEGNELTLIDLLCEDEDTVITTVETKMVRTRLLELIREVLDEREHEIIVMRYGLENREPLTQREVAKFFGISRSYVSRIEKKALLKIREYVEKEELYT